MDKLLERLVGTPWWLVLAIAVYGFCWAIYRDLPAHEPSRKRWIGYLAQNTWSNRYRKLLGTMLDWVDARLTPEISNQDWNPGEARAAWSHGLLNLSLLLAVAYPVLSVIVYWAVTNRDGGIGSLVLFEGGETAWLRAAALGLLAGSLAAAIIVRRALGHMRPVFALVAFGLALVIAFAIALIFAVADPIIGPIVGPVAAAIAIAFEGVGGVAIAGAFAFAAAFVVAFPFAVAVANGVPTAIAGAFMLAQQWAGWRTGRPMLFLLLYAIVVFVAIAAALRFGSHIKPGGNSTVLFLVILPLINAAADFASTGLTRWRLRKGLAGRMWREMLIDLAGAALAFFLLGAFTIVAIDHMRWADGSALFDLREFFTDIRANPGHYWWLYFTLFSTLIPTVLHGAVAVFGTGIHLWPGLRRFIVEGLDAGGQGDAVKGRWAVQALCLSMTVSVVAPIFVLGHIVLYRGIFGFWLLDLFEGFARMVGAI